MPATASNSCTPDPVQEKPSPISEETVQKERERSHPSPTRIRLPLKSKNSHETYFLWGLTVLIAATGSGFTYHRWDLHYWQSEQHILDRNLSEVSEELGQVPSFSDLESS